VVVITVIIGVEGGNSGAYLLIGDQKGQQQGRKEGKAKTEEGKT
jgi:hypothetical protein